MNAYLVKFDPLGDYKTYWADDVEHAYEQAKDDLVADDTIDTIYLCIMVYAQERGYIPIE